MMADELQINSLIPDAELFKRVTQWIRRAKNLPGLLAEIVKEVGNVLECDRIKIYQFNVDETGTVVAEWIREQRLPSLLGLTFPADDIPPEAREMFAKTGARSIVNLADHQIGQSGIDPSAPDEIRYRPLSSCHAEYLTAMGVQSSLVVPILQEAKLWGLFVIHHAEARSLSESQVDAVQMVVDLLAVAIAQSQLIEAAQARANRESVLNQVSRLLHSLSTIELQTALETAVTAFSGSGGRLWICAKSLAFEWGSQPSVPAPFVQLEKYSVWQEKFQSEQDSIWAIADLYKEAALRNLQPAFRASKIRGLLILPLWYRQELLGYLTIFRDEIETQILWAGQVDPDQRQLYPRQSFDVWCDSRRGQPEPWTSGDLELGCAIALQFATAIQQYETHQQLQVLNAGLELQVQERTARLQQATLQSQQQAQQLEEALKTLKHTQAQLIQTEKMSSLGRLVAGVAHEINNPVNFIHGNLNHLNQYILDILSLLKTYQKVYPEPETKVSDQIAEIDLDFIRQDLPKTLTSMQVGTDRIREIVLSLRNFSRLDHAGMKRVDIHEGIESTLLILQHQLNEVELIKEYGELPLVECYAGQLNQVFMNLLSNAIDALTDVEAPKIQIRTKQIDQNRVLIAIADNGSGISAETQTHIFDPFFTTKEIGKGTGMGLAISYEIVVQAHQGTLNCHSELGQGTEFWIEIPICQSTSA